jgi:hypothetical protein
VGACLPGAGYASGCDVDQDGDIDIFDIQRTAGRWNSSGAYTAGHTHWGETWTSAAGNHGLRLEHTASSGFTYGLYAQSASSNGIGLAGRTTASTGGMGVYGRSDGAGGYGVYGAAAATRGPYGVYGYSASSGGYAGYFTGVGPDALYVENGGGGRAIQVHALNDTAVWTRTTTAMAGVDGEQQHHARIAGYASAGNSGATRGVWGQMPAHHAWLRRATPTASMARVPAPTGRASMARPRPASGYTYGLYGESASTNGRGVYGLATASSGTAIGVYGVTGSSSGYAGYFVGSVHVLGNLSKSAGSFKIDHPLDPANQYLYHSFVESPDMKNIYDGVVTLDARGEAMVTLPDWFEALNRDFRYQLTPIGAAMPNLYVAQKCRTTPSASPAASRAWRSPGMVTGIRQDAYADAHRIPVEAPSRPTSAASTCTPSSWASRPSWGWVISLNNDPHRRAISNCDLDHHFSQRRRRVHGQAWHVRLLGPQEHEGAAGHRHQRGNLSCQRHEVALGIVGAWGEAAGRGIADAFSALDHVVQIRVAPMGLPGALGQRVGAERLDAGVERAAVDLVDAERQRGQVGLSKKVEGPLDARAESLVVVSVGEQVDDHRLDSFSVRVRH